jgi:ABC-2 type transport system permease protein
MLKEINLFFIRKLMETRRNPVFMFMSLTTPLLYLGLYAPLLKGLALSQAFPSGNVLIVFVPGMLTLVAFGGGLFVGFGIVDELRSGVIERFRVTPVSRFAILGGMVLQDIVVTLASALFFVLIALPFGFRISIIGLAILLILLGLLVATTASFSYAVGLITKSEDKLAPITHGINMPLTLLSGMMLPISLAPTWLRTLAHFNPIYYVVAAARHLTLGELTDLSVVYAFLFMVPLTFFVMWWATRVFTKAVM